MTKRSVIRCCLSLLMTLYLVMALHYTSRAAAADCFSGIDIVISDTETHGFVTPADIDRELGALSLRIHGIRHDSLNTRELEQQIMSMDKIENADCIVLNDGSLRIDVTPLHPVARIFDTDGENYYINRIGKRMSAGPKYRIDVPVVTGTFSRTSTDPTTILPLLDYITSDENLSGFISAINVNNASDITLIPSISGHVISFGDISDIDNKFQRLQVFYKDVMPVRGWDMYDTISVKWRGQIVAKRCTKRRPSTQITVEEFNDIDSESTMMTGENAFVDDPTQKKEQNTTP